MAFKKRTYTTQQTVITATNLNEIQDAIIEAEKDIEAIKQNGGGGGGTSPLPEGGSPGQVLVVGEDGSPEWQTQAPGAGEPGPAGASAYEIAKANGFNGTEEDWLDSLQGEPGAPGEPGLPGPPGDPGQAGVSPSVSVSKSGKVTTISITDANGTQTVKINDGEDGKDGEDGEDAEGGGSVWTEDTTYPGCFYRMVDGEKEWLNPPMVLNTAYRTAERYEGKPVWVGLNDYGRTADLGGGNGIAFSNIDEEQFNYRAQLVDVHPYFSDGWTTAPYYHREDIACTEEPPYYLTEDGGGFTMINIYESYRSSRYADLNFYCRFKFTYDMEW